MNYLSVVYAGAVVGTCVLKYTHMQESMDFVPVLFFFSLVVLMYSLYGHFLPRKNTESHE
jgi:dolichyl-phosphate-mannose--protein O-mannosyl transferase